MAQRRESTVDGKPGHVYIGRHLENGKPTGYYIIASAVKQTVEQRINFENRRFPVTELVVSFATSDAGVAEREARNRLCDLETLMDRRFPDPKKPPSKNSEWLFNEGGKSEDEIINRVQETCEEYCHE